MFWIKEEKQTIRKCVLYLCAFLCLLCMTKKFQPEAAMVVAENELVFVDSMTTENSVGDSVCHKKGISILKRDVFLDSTDDVNVVKNQLIKTAKIAQQKGYALGIGHVGPEGGNITVQAIKELAPLLEKQGIEFVTVSQLKEIISNS